MSYRAPFLFATTLMAWMTLGAVLPAPTIAAEAVTHADRSQRLPDGSLFIPKPVQRELGLRTTVAQAGQFAAAVELAGRVIADPAAGGRVQAAQGGTIAPAAEGLPVLGQAVRRGQVLGYLAPLLDSTNRADRRAALSELAAQLTLQERRLARLQQLEGSVPAKDIEQARIELESLRQREAALLGALRERLPLVAPVAGVVASSAVVAGQIVDARDVLFEIVDPNRLMVEAIAFDDGVVRGGGRASAQVDGRLLTLDFVGAGRQLREQGLPLWFRVAQSKTDQAAPPLAMGRSLQVLVETGTPQAGVALSRSAVTRNAANETMVWVHESPERFVPRRVRVTALDAARVRLDEGLAAGERVVVQGATALAQIR